MSNTGYDILATLFYIACVVAVDLAIVSFLVWAICKCFGFEFKWRIALGVWIIIIAAKNLI